MSKAKPTQKVLSAGDKFNYVAEMYDHVSGDLFSGELNKFTLDISGDTEGVSVIRVDTYEVAREIYSRSGEIDLQKYNEDYFKNNSIVLIYNWHPHYNEMDTYSDFRFDGKTFSVNIHTYYPGVCLEAIKSTKCIVEIEGRLPDDAKFKITKTSTDWTYDNPQQDVIEQGNVEFNRVKKYPGYYDVNETPSAITDLAVYKDDWTLIYYLETPKDLDTLYNAIKNNPHERFKYEYSVVSDVDELKKTYGEDYFVENSLLIVYKATGSGSVRVDLTGMELDGKQLICDVVTTIPIVGTDDMSSEVNIAEINGRLPSNTEITPRFSYIDEQLY